ncbi:hypothetical protein BGZ83_002082, partial [Gryganskiella cystojenkinii]
TFSDPVVKADPDNLIIDAKKGSSALATIDKSAGTFDVVHHDDTNYVCIGIRLGGCCLGLCIQ